MAYLDVFSLAGRTALVTGAGSGFNRRLARVLARFGRLVSINSALQFDLSGQADFSGAAAGTGARSIIALCSCSGDASTIVAALDGGTVTTARADVVVTEHGVAHLRGCPLSERAARLAAIAAPHHREALLRGQR